MRFYTVLASRPAFYDRSPLAIVQSYNAGAVAPHSITNRVTYTVPAARKATITTLSLLAVRDVAAGAAGAVTAQAYLNIAAAGNVAFQQAEFISITVNATSLAALGNGPVINAGDALNLFTADISTGGSVQYNLGFTATEFTA